ncbi:DEAD-box ATP-dependent RNA helicase 28 [Symbiodinium microadriaticum]|uniref:DEAD-box ATP-dependent RNA helicase 28 n=1 Tax=Symbiodinium microadriaticum TaxID=2951 RepID=A0A1Q9EQS3_SYMMI|nr:DEAD-box ATP-dependent RNA helicase 28 [Symbiodinium microadriaticum]
MGRTGRAVSIYTPEEYPKVKLLGRECSSKVQSKVLRRSIAAEAIQHWADKVASFEEDITAIIQEESVDKELRLADLLTQKSDNLEKHKKDIAARPAKEWFMSNKEKAKLKQSEKQSLEEAEAKALARDDEKKESKKRKKGPLTEEELQEKRAQRNRSTASKEEISKAAPSGEGPATAGKLIQKYVTAVKRGRGQDQEGSAGKQDWAIYQEQLKQSFVKERNRYQEDAKRLGKAQKMKALITIQSILADPKKELEVKPEIPEDYEATREWDHLMVEANRAEEHMEVDERDALLLSPGIAQRRIQELPAKQGRVMEKERASEGCHSYRIRRRRPGTFSHDLQDPVILEARLKAKREAEKAEREREQLRARASAKRSRRAQRDAEEFPLTIGERIFKQKMERRKKKGNKGKAAKKGKAR